MKASSSFSNSVDGSPDGKNESSHDIGNDARKKLLDRLSEEMFERKVKDVTHEILDDESNPVVNRTFEAVGEDSGALDFVYDMNREHLQKSCS
ncbi:unnamed protein product [Haemonchus placei]|uniref:PUM-HD domain-containing protein n=1 Tax=Haemonchus placei TaxID=6290 RepID=A0A0N4VVC7_HAEPC|nr:unnamed protein product [Haemonchus placei]